MAFAPPNPSGALDAFSQLSGTAPPPPDGFQADIAPSISGWGTRQSRIPDQRPAISTRNLMHFLVPEGPIVQMYINPQNITISERKTTSPTRTKGGFTIQYWGEELTTLKIRGTTGSSGIEGINVLHDIYRNEQLALDPYALFLAQANDSSFIDGGALGGALGGAVGSAIGGLLTGASTNNFATRPRPSLAYLAFTVEIYWSGEVYRGFFTDFSVEESVDHLGLFNYDIGFTVTQKRGFRLNFLPWHRSAISGPSNSNAYFGTPHSYGILLGSGDTPIPQREAQPTILDNIVNSFGSF